MMQDIFIPTSSTDDALVGPLHTVTYITANKVSVERILTQGYGLDCEPWMQPSALEFAALNAYLGFAAEDEWEASIFFKRGAGNNGRIRVISVDDTKAQVRPTYEGLYNGGATISCPMVDMRAHEKVMSNLGVESTMGVKEMEFTAPTGETYISGEIVYKMPEHVFLLGVTRPDIFVPVGPIDPETGIGGPAYSARCVENTDAIVDFLQTVLAYEIRRDVGFVVGEQSAINLPEGTKERFIQAFAPGASTGYLVFMDHGVATKSGPAKTLGPPSRGIGMWSLPTDNIEEVHARAVAAKVEIVHQPAVFSSPFLGTGRSMLMLDPDGFPIEIFENTRL